mmetsp:Transcript_34010/g.104598  ORF Transcript_34010/g.104598 Transcript_34010/m.104598 type:complete len:216 (+) Transcript_34010:43-690(+)
MYTNRPARSLQRRVRAARVHVVLDGHGRGGESVGERLHDGENHQGVLLDLEGEQQLQDHLRHVLAEGPQDGDGRGAALAALLALEEVVRVEHGVLAEEADDHNPPLALLLLCLQSQEPAAELLQHDEADNEVHKSPVAEAGATGHRQRRKREVGVGVQDCGEVQAAPLRAHKDGLDVLAIVLGAEARPPQGGVDAHRNHEGHVELPVEPVHDHHE